MTCLLRVEDPIITGTAVNVTVHLYITLQMYELFMHVQLLTYVAEPLFCIVTPLNKVRQYDNCTASAVFTLDTLYTLYRGYLSILSFCCYTTG